MTKSKMDYWNSGETSSLLLRQILKGKMRVVWAKKREASTSKKANNKSREYKWVNSFNKNAAIVASFFLFLTFETLFRPSPFSSSFYLEINLYPWHKFRSLEWSYYVGVSWWPLTHMEGALCMSLGIGGFTQIPNYQKVN